MSSRSLTCCFSNGLRKVIVFKAKLYIKENPIPKFTKARPVPFGLEEAVGKEFERLEEEDILQSIPFSDWASPIVVVTKQNACVVISNKTLFRSLKTMNTTCLPQRNYLLNCKAEKNSQKLIVSLLTSRARQGVSKVPSREHLKA